MIRIDLRPVWRFRNGAGAEREFDFQLVAILAQLDAAGKLTQAAEKAGISYRHAWNLVAEWEAFFGEPLVSKERGRGSTLTALGERLLWAGRRAQARLAPELDNLATEFARSLNESLGDAGRALVVHASHDFAVGELRPLGAGGGLDIDVQYKGSFDALAALRRGECDLAGFHVPEGRLGELLQRRFAEGLAAGPYRILTLVRRLQGLIVKAGNPKGIRGVDDLVRPDVRLVNRQRGSGTRALLEFYISTAGLDRDAIRGYDSEEATHGAVAAMIAGRQADVGLGVEAAAVHYRLDFVPLVAERYVLAFHEDALDRPAMRALVAMLRGPEFAAMVSRLAGYDASGAGQVHGSLEAAMAAPVAAA